MPRKIIDAQVLRDNYEQRYGLFRTRSQEEQLQVRPVDVGSVHLINDAYCRYFPSIVLRVRTYSSGLRLN